MTYMQAGEHLGTDMTFAIVALPGQPQKGLRHVSIRHLQHNLPADTKK
jgi:hypothetical protein